jgi:nucleoid DNA-binding protein
MANDKLSWTQLCKEVAQMANCSEQEAQQFLNAFVEAILAGLQTDKQVKIKGIGTFTVKAIAPRKSVNIATGEEFVIKGYNKLTFTAESMLKESVEKRIDTPKTEEIIDELSNDPIKKLGEQAIEIVDILTDLGQAPNSQQPVTPELPEQPELPETPEEPQTPETTETPEEPQTPETPEVPQAPVAPTTPAPEKRCKGVCWIILLVVLLGCAGAGWYFRNTLIQWWQCMQDCQPQLLEEVQEPQAPIITEPAIDTLVVDTTIIDSIPVIEEAPVPLAEQPREHSDILGIEVVNKASRLTWIAYKYYGEKDLWVFIFEANRDIIKHPAQVKIGQKLRIPNLPEQYRDLSNPEVRALVDSLSAEYLKKK